MRFHEEEAACEEARQRLIRKTQQELPPGTEIDVLRDGTDSQEYAPYWVRGVVFSVRNDTGIVLYKLKEPGEKNPDAEYKAHYYHVTKVV